MNTPDYQVFISFKNTGANGKPTPDAATARKVYEALRAAEVRVFFSEESLADSGRGEYARSIQEALETAEVLVLVGSCREHIESQWVSEEWGSFLEEIRTGRKQGELFIINCGALKPSNLPLFLRRHQMFNADDLGLEQLAKYVRKKLPQPVTLDDRIRLSLHCRNPKKNEDKIYLVTAHSPNGAGINVTAHWGPRKAKRLASQLKAMNLESEAEVHSLVEKLKKEKVSAGYRPAPHAKLLTREARAFLEATLGLAARVKVFAALGDSHREDNSPPLQPKQPKPKLPEKPSPKRSTGTLEGHTEFPKLPEKPSPKRSANRLRKRKVKR